MPENDPIQRSRAALLARLLAAALVLFVGADHYYEYSVDQYSVLPTIGTLFLLNFISATAVGVLLLAPLERLLHRASRRVLEIASISGLAIAASSLVALLISEQTRLFGFMELNYRPAIVVAIVSEAAAAVATLVLLILTVRTEPAPRPTPTLRLVQARQRHSRRV